MVEEAEDAFRVERDSMGEVRVPGSALWGAQTQRAYENFQISNLRFPRDFLGALGMIKYLACQANRDLGLLDTPMAQAIAQAAMEVTEGQWDDQFPLDIFQTGSGTSTNMNANEVIASRANEILGTRRVHPNDHVNMSQSSNDVIPSCIHIAALVSLEKDLLPALASLQKALEAKAKDFSQVVKIGRTHLQDATPVTLGQEFGGYASMVAHSIGRLGNVRWNLSELPLGGTAVGTGINAPHGFADKVIERLNDLSGLEFREAENHFEAQGSRDAVVEASAALKTTAVSLIKITNDLRWLGSGPRAGLGEIRLPSVQPGSSIMPGKTNPVMAEALLQVCVQVIGNDAAITFAGASGNFELNVMMPIMAYNLLQSLETLTRAVSAFETKCVAGLEADADHCKASVERSLAMVTALSPRIGYDNAAALAKEAYVTGKTVRQVALERGVLKPEELHEALDPMRLTRGGTLGKPSGGGRPGRQGLPKGNSGQAQCPRECYFPLMSLVPVLLGAALFLYVMETWVRKRPPDPARARPASADSMDFAFIDRFMVGDSGVQVPAVHRYLEFVARSGSSGGLIHNYINRGMRSLSLAMHGVSGLNLRVQTTDLMQTALDRYLDTLESHPRWSLDPRRVRPAFLMAVEILSSLDAGRDPQAKARISKAKEVAFSLSEGESTMTQRIKVQDFFIVTGQALVAVKSGVASQSPIPQGEPGLGLGEPQGDPVD